ncbi:hypothetical protein J31TS4_02670 [Paenibacillus sp. J31TS4]|uniref:ATP-binding protein n=1 Tax=Paenibacillus sp. J31TS4 TaxID=2807195 RepID=UPI001B226D93|nr:ATP-binding protein [Paenibacillus sp. J31TS4]GIP36987.1 hypothetical protein J31TS4_02670 [Paenibacillus sp. J31TS4]
MTRNLAEELDALKGKLEEIEAHMKRLSQESSGGSERRAVGPTGRPAAEGSLGALYYSGEWKHAEQTIYWEPQQREAADLLGTPADKASKIFAAIGHKQRLEILLAVLKEPLTGTELVERLHMGTTGQLYHHLKALLGADLLVQEERGGRYAVPAHRSLSLLLLLASVTELLDTSNYLDMTEARSNPGIYLGAPEKGGYDPHQLLWAVMENSILEHKAGYCTEVNLYLHEDGSVTVADDGRGIPVAALAPSGPSIVQRVLTEISRTAGQPAPEGKKGVEIAVVNALSSSLTVDIRRDGRMYRQSYRNGIPQTGLQQVGETRETGTSVTFLPNAELFAGTVDREVVEARLTEWRLHYPDLRISVTGGASLEEGRE